jgi:hypothetical protein
MAVTYNEYLANITNKAAVIDDDNKAENRGKRVVNNAGRGRGRIRENRPPCSAQSSGRGSGRTPSKVGFVTDAEYNKMTPDEKKKLYEKRKGISAAPVTRGTYERG